MEKERIGFVTYEQYARDNKWNYRQGVYQATFLSAISFGLITLIFMYIVGYFH